MEINKLYRGRLVDHVQLVVHDLAASRRFYEAIFDVLGIRARHGFYAKVLAAGTLLVYLREQ